MAGLPSEVYRSCRTTLLKCSEFDSDESLRAVFATNELSPFRHAVPEATRKADRVDGSLAYLLAKRLRDGRALLPIFLDALSGRYEEGDALRDELHASAKEAEAHLHPGPTPITPPEATAIPTSTSMNATEGMKSGAPMTSPAQTKMPEKAEAKTEPEPQTVKPYWVVLGSGLFGFLMGVLGNLVAAWIQQDVLDNTFTPITVVSIVGLTTIGLTVGALLQRHLVGLRMSRIWLVVFAALGAVIIIAAVVALRVAFWGSFGMPK